MIEKIKKYELTTKGKIIFGVGLLLIIGLIIFLVIPKGKEIDRISLEMGYPNEGIIVDDPILGISTNLKVGKKIKLLNTVYPENHKKEKIEYISENPEIAYIEEEMVIGKSEGTTKIYAQTNNGKVKSNKIEITIEGE